MKKRVKMTLGDIGKSKTIEDFTGTKKLTRLTADIDEDLYKRFTIKTIEQDLTIREVTTKLIQDWVDKR